ncbi:MAG: hypothetical protein MUF21_04900 [Gemmatimonadaceae bacterium]|nr:hypothetical protein [Gemmatimonadaceae bacterium]
MSRIGGVGGEPSIPSILTGPVVTGIPGSARVGTPVAPVDPVPPVVPGAAEATPLADVALAGRLATGDVLPEPAALALALEQATRALQGGRAHDVLATLDATWSARLAHDAPWYLRAAALELLARGDDAAAVLRDAIAALPRSAALLYLLGVHALAGGDDGAAQLATSHAVALHPDDPVLLTLRAAIEMRAGRAPEAEALLARASTRAGALPVREWFAALVRMPATRGASMPGRATAPTPRGTATMRATPRALPAVTPGAMPITSAARQTPHASPLVRPTPHGQDAVRATPLGSRPIPSPDSRDHESLHEAVRYGLALLDPPAVAAREAVRRRTRTGELLAIAAQHAGIAAPPIARRPPHVAALLVAVLLVGGLTTPVTRTAAMVVAGACLAWWALRRPQRRDATADLLATAAPHPGTRGIASERTVDRRIA